MIGTKVGSWLVTEEIGDGGHAFVFKGVAGDQVAAIKMLKPSVAAEENLERRFKIEAEALRDLDHPAIVGFKDYLYENGYHYLVLEYMDAGSAEHLLKTQGPVEARYVIPIIYRVLEGMNYAHSFGYIHRDMKPNNILLNRRGEAKLTDFGITKVIGGENLTKKGFVLGTTLYMAPEYLSQGLVSPQTDIYAMGVTMFEMVTNRKPFEYEFEGEPLVAFAKRVCLGNPTPPSTFRPVPAELERILLKAVSRDPKKRYKSVERFRADLKKSFPDLVERPIEIPDGRPRTRILQRPDLSDAVKEPVRVSVARGVAAESKPIRFGPVFLAALLAGCAAGALVQLLAQNLGIAISVGLAIVAAVFGAGWSRQRARSQRPVPPPKEVSVPSGVPDADDLGTVKEPDADEMEDEPDTVPFHGGVQPRGTFQETEVSELSAFLEVVNGGSKGKRYGLRPISRIGRDLRFDIRPQDPEISRHHAALTFTGVGFTVKDLGSTNGTFVNEVRIEGEEDINTGDIVRVGRTSMRFEHLRR